jgi:hypothetical protein
MLVEFIASENVAVTLVVGETPVAPLAGETLLTVGGVVSTVRVRAFDRTEVFPAASVALAV